MVSRVGDLKDGTPGPNENNAGDEMATDQPQERHIIQSIAKNIRDLAEVLCSEDNAPLFLKFDAPSNDAPNVSQTAAAGTLATLVIHCVANLPLQTSTYVGLTLAVEQFAPSPEYSGFSERCVNYTMAILSSLIDQVLIRRDIDRNQINQVTHLLRYLAILTKINIVSLYSDEEPDASLTGLLKMFTQAAIRTTNRQVSYLLKHWVLSTLPYLPPLKSDELEALWADLPYYSTFEPGLGSRALLLKSAQYEEEFKDSEEDDEEEEEEEEEEETTSKICDNLQDLSRCTRSMIQDMSTGRNNPTRFTLLTDAPWEGLDYSSVEPIPLPALNCKSIAFILQGNEPLYRFYPTLETAFVFGRLPIFGSPSSGEDDPDDEEDEIIKSEQLQAYEKKFGILDRYFVADCVRDCLLSHQCSISESGVARGSPKETAQQIWSIRLVIRNENDDSIATGIEYVIVETLLSMILQSSPTSFLKPIFISQVLLELVRAEPSVMPQALAVGVSNLFQFYLPSLAPLARDNLSRWFSFHLTNTDYQWPKAFWDHWSAYLIESRNSRGDFVKFAIQLMGENLSTMGTMVSIILPEDSPLPTQIFTRGEQDEVDQGEDFVLKKLEKNVAERLWEKKEDPDLLRSFIIGDEVAELLSGRHQEWHRTRAVIRSLLRNVEKHDHLLAEEVENADKEDSMETIDDATNREDVLVVTTDNIIRYQNVLEAALQQDLRSLTGEKQKHEGTVSADLLTEGRARLLREVAEIAHNSQVMLRGCLEVLLERDVIQTKSVLEWLLHTDQPVAHWWDYAGAAFRVGLEKAADKDRVDMIFDRSGEDDVYAAMKDLNSQIAAINSFASPTIREAVVKVSTKIAEFPDSKRMVPLQVEFLEGLKYFIISAHSLVLEALSTVVDFSLNTKPPEDIMSTYTGRALGEVCRSTFSNSGHCSHASDALANMLDAL
jgi:hypothetical protein